MLFFSNTKTRSHSESRGSSSSFTRFAILSLCFVACATTVNGAPVVEMRAKAPLPAIHHMRSVGATYLPPHTPAQRITTDGSDQASTNDPKEEDNCDDIMCKRIARSRISAPRRRRAHP
ncbi:hypothetical protein M407DRAFT_244682 [Tulasnella calospora MUT 4182]|uniref:Secreted protein n=1 Tax=Tulasnella calospora MUT 4182 TaxID=1051891 RepID=A0A0C3LQP9_9AGAM|nr:hypothetical protein M407DRAFT_244682 [Tulasnella calospora MUT 4182]